MKEHDWNVFVDGLHLRYQISPLANNSHAMSNLTNHHHYKTLYEFRQTATIEDLESVYSRIFNYLSELSMHTRFVLFDVFAKDLRIELVDKVIGGIESIEPVLNNFDRTVLETSLKQAYQYFIDKNEAVAYAYNVCHGDLIGANILVNPTTLDVKFIRPRGYFGQTELYGWQQYEFAKLLFGLMGGDVFIDDTEDSLQPPLLERVLSDSSSIYNKLNTRDNLILVAINYIDLANRISQNVNKANIAYEYGLHLLKRSLEEAEMVKNSGEQTQSVCL